MTKPTRKIDVEQLKAHLEYNPETGVFKRKLPHRGGKVGDVAGTLTNAGYINVYVCGTHYRAHRLAWLYVHGQMPDLFIDHINCNKSDNRISNLRLADKTDNAFNRPLQSNNKTSQKGVFLDKARGKYRAEAQWHNSRVFLGRFDTFEDAKKAYEQFAVKAHGEFYRASENIA